MKIGRNRGQIKTPINLKNHSSEFGKYMYRSLFENILACIWYKDKELESKYGLHQTVHMEEECNKNMAVRLKPVLLNFLGKSTIKWFNKYLPGFMCVVHKSQPFVMERHTISCELSSIIQIVGILEEKD